MEFAVIILFVVVGLPIAYVLSSRNKSHPVAEQLGLEVTSRIFGTTVMEGVIDGVAVQATERIHSRADGGLGGGLGGVQKYRWYSHTVVVTIPCALPTGLQVSVEGFGAGLGKMIGMQDIVVGHQRLDDLVIIKGKKEDVVKELFSRPGIAGATFSLFDRYGGVTLSKNELSIELKQRTSAMTKQMIVSFVEYANILAGKADYSGSEGRLFGADVVDMNFEDNARFVEEEIARRKAEGRFEPSAFDREVPEILDEAPAFHVSERPEPQSDWESEDRDGSW